MNGAIKRSLLVQRHSQNGGPPPLSANSEKLLRHSWQGTQESPRRPSVSSQGKQSKLWQSLEEELSEETGRKRSNSEFSTASDLLAAGTSSRVGSRHPSRTPTLKGIDELVTSLRDLPRISGRSRPSGLSRLVPLANDEDEEGCREKTSSSMDFDYSGEAFNELLTSPEPYSSEKGAIDQSPSMRSSQTPVLEQGASFVPVTPSLKVELCNEGQEDLFEGDSRHKYKKQASAIRQVVTKFQTSAPRSLHAVFLKRSRQIEEMDDEEEETGFAELKLWLQHRSRVLLRMRSFQFFTFFCLIAALYLPDLCTIFDIDATVTIVVDIVLTFVFCIFLFEILVQWIGHNRIYAYSFWFYMDILGTLAMIFDVSYLSIMQGRSDFQNNAIMMRAARLAKLGARAGRFTKLVKVLRLLPGVRVHQDDDGVGTAKVISGQLLTAVSTRVACLIILMVISLPVFEIWTFPEQDWSMLAWLNIIESTGFDEYDSRQWSEQVSDFEQFYLDLDYFPYELIADFPDRPRLIWRSRVGSAPLRSRNIMRIQTDYMHCDFNFTVAFQLQAVMNLSLTTFMLGLMIGFSLIVSNSVHKIVVRPLEQVFSSLKRNAEFIMDKLDMVVESAAERMTSRDSVDEDGLKNGDELDETHLLRMVVDRLHMVSKWVSLGNDQLSRRELEHMGAEQQGVMESFGEFKMIHEAGSVINEVNIDGEVMRVQLSLLADAGLSAELIDSWRFNPLELDMPRCHAACMYFLGPHNHGLAVEPATLQHYLQAMQETYGKVPYHSWFHAVDVVHSVYRFLQIFRTSWYLGGLARFALLVGAVAHDSAHPGFNNSYIVESAHELALRYNDKSPLENMHCARLFEILVDPYRNVFGSLSAKDFQEARKVCITSILHTDNAHHFQMQRDLQVFYEVNSELLTDARSMHLVEPDSFPLPEVVMLFQAPDARENIFWKILLHLADLANPTKPFKICDIWARRVLEEFFSQGDMERRIGLPVGYLNDRDQVNIPLSQVGFIEFLVAPYALSVAHILPPYDDCVQELALNVTKWQEVWVKDVKPEQEQLTEMQDRISKLVKKLRG